MKCIECGSETIIRNTRAIKNNIRWRRRACICCGVKFTTIEVAKNDFYNKEKAFNLINTINSKISKFLGGNND